MTATAQTLSPPSRTLMFLEGRAFPEFGAFLGALPLLSLAPKGDGHPVLVFPGLVASGASTRPLRKFLKSRGYAASGWRQGRNSDCARVCSMRWSIWCRNSTTSMAARSGSSAGAWRPLRAPARQNDARARAPGDHARQPLRRRPRSTNAGASMRWRAAVGPTKRMRVRRRAAVPTTGADDRDLQPHRRRLRLAGLYGADHRDPKASKSKAAIAAWAIIPPPSMRSPIASRRPKANGRRSTVPAGAAWCIRTRIGKWGVLLGPAWFGTRGVAALLTMRFYHP